MSIVQALLMSANSGMQARFIYSIALPVVCLEQISVIDAFLTIFNLRKPSWFNKLWFFGLLFLSFSVVFNEHIYPLFTQVPDGYWLASSNALIGFTVLKSSVYGINLLCLILVVIHGVKRHGHRKRWPYAVSILSYGICLFNDSVILQHYRTLYPTTWIAAVVFFAMLWGEVRWHMEDLYKRLDRDMLTGAYSRSFGENYLSELLETQSVGLFYADVDNFKEVNDTFGHQAGDEKLKLMVELVRPIMNMPNALVRLGGDEFLFIFPGANSNDAESLRHQICSLIQGVSQIENDDKCPLNLHVSLGWGFVPKGSSWMSAIHMADLSMYLDKGSKTRGARV